MANSAASDWWFNHVSRLGRLINQVNRESYRPMPNPNRSYYTTMLWILEGIMFIDVFFWQFVAWYPPWLSLWPLVLSGGVLVSTVSGQALWDVWKENAPKCRPGIHELFTCTDESVNIQPALYLDDVGSGHISIYQMKLLGGLLGNWVKGSFVLISRVLQTDAEEELTNWYNTNKRMPALQEGRKFNFGIKWGDITEVPGDLEYYVLGNENDGLEPEIRNWIKRTYQYWSPLWVVMIARDVLQERKVFLDNVQPVTHRTGHDWALADAQREMNYWKAKHEEIVRQHSTVNRIAARGRRSPYEEEVTQ
jgi:hypothetical protein